MPYDLRSGDEGESERDSEGGDLSDETLDGRSGPADDAVECDLEGREPSNDRESRFESFASIGPVAIEVKGGYEYEVTGSAIGEGCDDQRVCGGYGESMTGR
jgi:hypothetical protein